MIAVLDDKSQNYLNSLHNLILQNNISGVQTMDIPFHITLGSFSCEYCEEVKNK